VHLDAPGFDHALDHEADAGVLDVVVEARVDAEQPGQLVRGQAQAVVVQPRARCGPGDVRARTFT
jgi:hypothetical protein